MYARILSFSSHVFKYCMLNWLSDTLKFQLSNLLITNKGAHQLLILAWKAPDVYLIKEENCKERGLSNRERYQRRGLNSNELKNGGFLN